MRQLSLKLRARGRTNVPGLGLCQPTNLILQMKERREPMHMRIDDCCPSFFTVPVFRSKMRPVGERSTVGHEPLPENTVGARGGRFAETPPHQDRLGKAEQTIFLTSPVCNESWNPHGHKALFSRVPSLLVSCIVGFPSLKPLQSGHLLPSPMKTAFVKVTENFPTAESKTHLSFI